MHLTITYVFSCFLFGITKKSPKKVLFQSKQEQNAFTANTTVQPSVIKIISD